MATKPKATAAEIPLPQPPALAADPLHPTSDPAAGGGASLVPTPVVPPVPDLPVPEPGQSTTEFWVTVILLTVLQAGTGIFVALAAGSVIHPDAGAIQAAIETDGILSGAVGSIYTLSRGIRKSGTSG